MALGNCPEITLEKIRAIVTIGAFTVETPYVKSFSIQRSRGSLAATCSVSLEIPVTSEITPGADITVDRVVNGVQSRRFTGTIDSVDVEPVFERANYYMLNIQASDIMKRLENRQISRRFKMTGMSVFAAITGVTHERATQRGITIDKKIADGDHQIMWPSMALSGDNSDVIKAPNFSSTSKQTDVLPKLGGAQSDRDMVGSNVISYDIVPKIAIVGEGSEQVFSLDPVSDYVTGSTWSVSDSTLGSLVDNEDGTIVYTQLAAGIVTITYTDASAYTGTAIAQSMPLHTHEDLLNGGPAWGVYKTE